MKPLFNITSPTGESITGVGKSQDGFDIPGYSEYKSPFENPVPISVLSELTNEKAVEMGFQSNAELLFYVPFGLHIRKHEILLIK